MLKKLFKLDLFLLPVLAALFFALPFFQWIGLGSGVLLSAVSIHVSAWVLEAFWEREWNVFNKVFFFSLIGRFFIVVTVLGILLATTKIDEIYFTVSFIISYLCYSITEMIFFTKILEKKSSTK
ncbi:MAG: hypothetical protein JJ971_12095 [Balneolaceae bacterium]|nr:hypothetical protein [Balneolaceae bacterium]MBO6547408.1 hypothetical protein [Balneolaceae bacterium]MBO6647645.1 hypothetical protein [Balneolaceae bacterium]